MVNKCCVVGYRIVPVFSFPSDEDIKNHWIKFVNMKDLQPTPSAVFMSSALNFLKANF